MIISYQYHAIKTSFSDGIRHSNFARKEMEDDIKIRMDPDLRTNLK